MKFYACLLTTLTAAVSSLTAATYTFETSPDYTNNFTPGYTGGSALVLSSTSPFGNHLAKYDSNASASYALLTTPVGTTSYSLKADVVFAGTYGSASLLGFGFATNIGANNGYTAIFRFTGTNTADFRVFEGTNATTGTIGTQVNTPTSFTRASGTWSTNTYYTLNLDVINTGSSISFTGSVLTTGGTVLGTFDAFTDTTPASVSNTSVGFRMGVNAYETVRMDNFTVTAIPEPSTYALLGGAGVLGLALCTRRKRA
jgi:hypothetical protein